MPQHYARGEKQRRVRDRLRVFARSRTSVICMLLLVTGVTTVLAMQMHEFVRDTMLPQKAATQQPEPFPVSVNPAAKLITENTTIEGYIRDHLPPEAIAIDAPSPWERAVAALIQWKWYQNLASPGQRTLVVQAGERREEVADHFGDILGWDAAERAEFAERVASSTPVLADGKFFPGRYTVHRNATPETVAGAVTKRFEEEILSRYTDDITAHVPLTDALIIASLLEREATDFTDMRRVAGVIWNRLFVDMRLQIDATLQYAKGSRPYGPWWPRVHPDDKFIDSLFNTYQNEGLPPAPIANPSIGAVLAALNPISTDCMYYFHNARGEFYCTPTYEEHVMLLKQQYGQGR